MANTKSSKSMEVPEAKAAMDRFKTEVASELGVNLKEFTKTCYGISNYSTVRQAYSYYRKS